MDTSKKYRIPWIQATELKKVNKQKGLRENDSISFGREKTLITAGRGRVRSGRERGLGEQKGNVIRYEGENMREILTDSNMNGNMQPRGMGGRRTH